MELVLLVFAVLVSLALGVAVWLGLAGYQLRLMLLQRAGLSARAAGGTRPAWPEAGDYALRALEMPEAPSEADRGALAEIAAFAEQLEQRLRAGAYLALREGRTRLDWARINDDLLAYLRAIAAHYHPVHPDPLLALRPVDIAHVTHRTTLILLGVMERSPLGLHEMTLEELVAWFRRAQQVLSQYRDLRAIWDRYHLGAIWTTARWAQLLLAPTPAGLAVAVGGEVARRLVRRYGPDVVFALAVRQRIELIARTVGYEAMRTFGSGVHFRTREWLVGCELAAMFRELSCGPEATKALLAEVGRLRFPSSYERVTVLGFFSDPTGLDAWLARNARVAAELPDAETDAVARQCEGLLARFHDPGGEAMWRYVDGFRRRWRRGLAVPALGWTDTWHACCRSWAEYLARVRGLVDPQERAQELGAVAAAVGRPLAHGVVDEAVDESAPFVPVALDPADPLCAPYLEGLVEATVRHPRRTLNLDDALAAVDRFYRGKTDAARRLRARWETVYAGLREQGGVFDGVDAAMRRAILAALEPGERLLGVYRASERAEGGTTRSWTLVRTQARLFLAAPDPAGKSPRGEPIPGAGVTLLPRPGRLADALVLRWTPAALVLREIVVEARTLVSREARFRGLVAALAAAGADDRTGWALAPGRPLPAPQQRQSG